MDRTVCVGLLLSGLIACGGRDLQFSDEAACGGRAGVSACGTGRQGIGSKQDAGGALTGRLGNVGVAGRPSAASGAGAWAREGGAGAATLASGASGVGASDEAGRSESSGALVGCGNGVREAGEKCDGDCPTSCPTPIECLRIELRGSAAACSAECVSQEVTALMPGDGCCPPGATHATDDDCPVSCGDGVVDGAEMCDPKSADRPCPTSCDDKDPCTDDDLVGSAASCNATCSHTPVTSALSGDQCCPPGANAASDSDCSPVCGNGVREAGEKCDGDCPTSASCSGSSACMKSTLSGSGCDIECKSVEITERKGGDSCCPMGANASNDSDCEAACGNGVREADEKCDGDCPTSASCSGGTACSRRMLTGAGCQVECQTVEITNHKDGDGCCPEGADATTDSDCEPRCGNGVREGSEKCDGDCPTSASCSGGNACSKRVLSGTRCDVECKTVTITEPKEGDQCCPAGANPELDSDCPTVCGDGAMTGGEQCDPRCAEFFHWEARCETCPTSCDDHDPSTVDTLRGTGCQSWCDYTNSPSPQRPMPDAGTPPLDPWT